ncbi:MAG: glycosyltransferase family 2 protein [Bryobacterales bacterium]|nr:glycosyltransferase family 2 protein [Bryobacterales bacterium]
MNTPGTSSLTIVIPAYNEEKRLPPTIARVKAYLSTRDWDFLEVLVVDDGSADDTGGVVEAHARHDPRYRLLRNPGNRGKGYSIRHGMLQARGDWVLFTDADLSTPMEELGKLEAAVRGSGAEVAIGSRAVDRSLVEVHQAGTRELAGRFFNVVMRICTGMPYLDTQCGFKLFRRDAAHAIFQRQQLDGFGFDVEALYLANKLGYRVEEVPVRWRNVEGTTVSLMRGLDAFVDILRVRWYDARGRYNRARE